MLPQVTCGKGHRVEMLRGLAMEMSVAVRKDMRPVMQHDRAGASGHIGRKAGMAAIHSLISGNRPHPHTRTDGE